MPFYTYRQNNSGGGFDIDVANGITITVIIEADSADDANAKAQGIGLYFDGCETGQDCECCGDRWYSAWRDDDGTDKPEIYGEVVDSNYDATSKSLGGFSWTTNEVPDAIVHYADGRVVGFDPFVIIKGEYIIKEGP